MSFIIEIIQQIYGCLCCLAPCGDLKEYYLEFDFTFLRCLIGKKVKDKKTCEKI